MPYLLDANVFIQAKNLHYGFDFCPAFWDWLGSPTRQARGNAVVTHEVPANSVHKVKIPNVCIGMGVKCMTPYEMLRVEGARFVLGRKES